VRLFLFQMGWEPRFERRRLFPVVVTNHWKQLIFLFLNAGTCSPEQCLLKNKM